MVEAERAPIVVTHEGGARFAAQVRTHRIVVDQTERGGGEDSAPMPIELLGVSLGTCIALYVRRFCETRGLPCDGMQVEVEQTNQKKPARVGAFSVRVKLPEPLPPPYGEMLERVAQSCPAHHTLAHETPIQVVIETPVLR